VLPECCAVLANTSDSIYYLENLFIPHELIVPGYNGASSTGIANTSTRLWSINNSTSEFDEWIITLSPFSATYNRSITYPVGFTTTSGMAAINNTTLLGVNDSVSPQEVVAIDVSALAATMTAVLTLQANREARANLLQTTGGKLLIINEDTVTNDWYLSQYDYSTAALEVDVLLPSATYVSLIGCDCYIIVIDDLGNASIVDSIYPYPLATNMIDTAIPNIISGSQTMSCVSSYIVPNTTTTTTTLACFTLVNDVIGTDLALTAVLCGEDTPTTLDLADGESVCIQEIIFIAAPYTNGGVCYTTTTTTTVT
jgi:hypothetical protein